MKGTTLGELEKQIMDIVWQEKHCSVREVLTKIQEDKKLAYTTVATILQRLYDKGLLSRREDKLGYIYSAKVTREKYSKFIAKTFLRKFIDSYGETAIASFADSVDSLSKDKRKYFLKLLEENEKNK